MTVEQWLTKIVELSMEQSKRASTGEITQVDDEMEALLMKARSDLTDEQGEELLKRVLLYGQDTVKELSNEGRPIPGNDPHTSN